MNIEIKRELITLAKFSTGSDFIKYLPKLPWKARLEGLIYLTVHIAAHGFMGFIFALFIAAAIKILLIHDIETSPWFSVWIGAGAGLITVLLLEDNPAEIEVTLSRKEVDSRASE